MVLIELILILKLQYGVERVQYASGPKWVLHTSYYNIIDKRYGNIKAYTY